MSLAFNEQNQQKFLEILTRYPTKQAALLPTLWLAQKQHGYLSLEIQEYVAGLLSLSPVHVYGVVTFYTMLKQRPVGKYHLKVCQTLSCALCGSEKLIQRLQDKYRLKNGEVTKDGKFSLELVECLASCGTAPAMMVNEAYVENLTTEKLDLLLAKLAKQ